MIHAVHSNNMSEMGGLRKTLPITFWTFLIGSLALSGVPPLAGFWSKDELLVVAEHEGHPVLFAVLLVTALLTAFYMTRAVLMTFFGEYRGHGEPHEAPRSMTGVLVALAAVTVVAGFVGSPQLGAVFGDWVYFQELEEALFVPWVAVLSTLAAVGGDPHRLRLVPRLPGRDPLRSLGGAYTLVANKFYIDDIYWKGIVRPIRDDVSSGVYWNDRHVIDGVVNGAAAFTKVLARGVNWFDEHVIDGAVNGLGEHRRLHRRPVAVHPIGQRPAVRRVPVHGVVVLAVIFSE